VKGFSVIIVLFQISVCKFDWVVRKSESWVIDFDSHIRFLASLRNDRGGGIMAFALSGMTKFLAALGMTAVVAS